MTMRRIVIRCIFLYIQVHVYFGIFMSVAAHGRPKRIAGGKDLPDHELYNTHFVVSLHNTHSCATDQFDHRFLDCQKNAHFCGGSLISPDFVMTACHCVTYADWYARPPRHRKKLTLGDIPPYIDDRIHYKPRDRDDLLVNRKKVSVQHPVLNRITIYAGSPHQQSMTQRRHAAKLFVHHLCAYRELKLYPELWADDFYEIDIGLLKTCYPFKVNKDVQLAHIKGRNKIDEHLHQMLHLSATCLFVGWGYALKDPKKGVVGNFETYEPDLLQHMFGYIQCSRYSTVDRHNCLLVFLHHGPNLAIPRSEDSGSPLICDGFLTAVHSRSSLVIDRNYSIAYQVSVACVKEFIGEGHLSYLKSLANAPFHYVNGKPVDGTFP